MTKIPKIDTEEKSVFQTNSDGKSVFTQNNQTRSFPVSVHKIQFQMDQISIRTLNTLRLLEENLRDILQLRGAIKDCLNHIQVVQEIRQASEKWDLTRPKSFSTAGKAVNQVKRHPQSERKSLSARHPTEDWCLHYTKNSRHKETTTTKT